MCVCTARIIAYSASRNSRRIAAVCYRSVCPSLQVGDKNHRAERWRGLPSASVATIRLIAICRNALLGSDATELLQASLDTCERPTMRSRKLARRPSLRELGDETFVLLRRPGFAYVAQSLRTRACLLGC